MDALQAAQVESLREQIESGAVSPTAGAVALTAAEKAVAAARERVESAEAGTGWLALTLLVLAAWSMADARLGWDSGYSWQVLDCPAREIT